MLGDIRGGFERGLLGKVGEREEIIATGFVNLQSCAAGESLVTMSATNGRHNYIADERHRYTVFIFWFLLVGRIRVLPVMNGLQFKNVICGLSMQRRAKRILHWFGDIIKGRASCMVSAREAIAMNLPMMSSEHPKKRRLTQQRFYNAWVARFPQEQFMCIDRVELWSLCEPVEYLNDAPDIVLKDHKGPIKQPDGLLTKALDALDLTIDDYPVLVTLEKCRGRIQERFFIPMPEALQEAILAQGEPEDEGSLSFFLSVRWSKSDPASLYLVR